MINLMKRDCPSRPARWAPIALAGLLAWPAVGVAAPRLRCAIRANGEVRMLEFSPQTDPYPLRAVEVGRSFRFKAVVIGDERQVDYIALYTYHYDGERAILLHEAKYLAPVAQRAPAPAALTGTHYLYAPGLGREMQYDCALFEVW